MTLREWMHELLRRWRWIAGGVILGLALGGLAAALTPAQYAAGTTLYVSPGIPTANTDAAYQGSLLSQQRMKSYVALLTGERVAQDVIGELALREPADEVAQKITAVAKPETLVLTVTARDSSPEGAAALANAAAASFGRLVDQLERTPGDPGHAPVRVQVVQPAKAPTTPVAPALSVNLVLGGVLGLLAGLGVAALRRALDDSVRSARLLQDLMDAPVLGVIPSHSGHPQSVLATDDLHQVEAYRRLRTNVHHTGQGLEHGAVVVTSAVRGEGRSTLVCNLAAALAASGSRILVVDADLRRPRLAEYLGMEVEGGLTDVLAGNSPVAEAIRPWRARSLDVLGSGPVPLNPSELVGSQQMADLLEELRQRYDVVLLDSPPLLEVTDGAELAAVADGAIMACHFGRTTYSQFRAGVEALSAVSAHLLGAVLTMVPVGDPKVVAARAGEAIAGSSQAVEAPPVLPGTLRPSRPRRPNGRHGSPRARVDPLRSDSIPVTAPTGAIPRGRARVPVAEPQATPASPNQYGTFSQE